MTPPLTQNLKTLDLWVFFLICCSTFSFLFNMRLRLLFYFLPTSTALIDAHMPPKPPILLPLMSLKTCSRASGSSTRMAPCPMSLRLGTSRMASRRRQCEPRRLGFRLSSQSGCEQVWNVRAQHERSNTVFGQRACDSETRVHEEGRKIREALS